jgi:ATPase subunit of ABC transporter with duplicated ATPase domains
MPQFVGSVRDDRTVRDEPDNYLDVPGKLWLEGYEGTILAVTHDRWFANSFDRFLVFGADGRRRESPEPVWDEGRVTRNR